MAVITPLRVFIQKMLLWSDRAHSVKVRSLHLVMKEALNLPDHYGRNLDALWDCLMEIRPAELYLRNAQLLEALPEGYGRKLIGLLEQAGEERKDFVFRQTKG